MITDIMMPGMDGLELITAVRTNPELGDMIIIAISGALSEKAALAAGANKYLIRTPKIARDLISAINDLTRHSEPPAALEMHAAL